MLDDLKYIHQIDKADALGIASKEPNQLLHSFEVELHAKSFANVVYAGMGGSALAASLSLTWPRYRVPFEIVRGYVLPEYVAENTLCIVASASGNTEEELSAAIDAERRGAYITVIAGGGKLAEIAKKKGYPMFLLPSARQPRYGDFYNLRALYEIGLQAGVIIDHDKDKLTHAADFLLQELKSWEPTVPISQNLAKQIALDSLGKSVVIYGGPNMAPAAYKWKINFNENAKQVAWTGVYSEFNHNEFIGWSEQPPLKPYLVVDLRSSFELPRIQERFLLSERLLSGRRPSPVVVDAKGANELEHLLYAVLLGDYVTLYAAIAAGNNPEPVELVEKFKKLLAEHEE